MQIAKKSRRKREGERERMVDNGEVALEAEMRCELTPRPRRDKEREREARVRRKEDKTQPATCT